MSVHKKVISYVENIQRNLPNDTVTLRGREGYYEIRISYNNEFYINIHMDIHSGDISVGRQYPLRNWEGAVLYFLLNKREQLEANGKDCSEVDTDIWEPYI